VFEKDKTYFVFFMFPKQATTQTYQIWVGKDFKKDKDFKGIKVTQVEGRFKYADWPAIPWKKDLVQGPDGVSDVLEVTVNFGAITSASTLFDPNPNAATNLVTCKPADFCTWNGSKSCGCSLSKTDPRVVANDKLLNLCKSTCSSWAVKDLDAPKDPDWTPPNIQPNEVPPEPVIARYGFAFTMRATPDDKSHRPPPEEIKTTDSAWSKFKFLQPTKAASAGAECTYSANQTPGGGNCPVQDCAMGETNPPMCDKK
jgi:hypothetical protein